MQPTESVAAGTTTAGAPPAPPPSVQLMQMVLGKMLTQMIGVTARLGVADQLADRPKSTDELAAAVGAHAPSLYRLLRALASVGIFAETDPGTFTLTPMAEALRSDARDSMRDLAIFFSSDMHNRCWNDLYHSVTTGGSAAEHAVGFKDMSYLETHPEEAEMFNRAMTSLSRQNAYPVAQAYDFSGVDTIVDVGGGHGFLLSAILQTNPTLKGVLFDLPPVVAGAQANLENAGVADRAELVGGSFLETIPEADCYIMKSVLHDWNDEVCTTILRNCRKAMRPGGKVLVVDFVIAPGNQPDPGKLIDMEMLTMTPGGYERTADQFRALFEAAGLKLTRVIPTKAGLSIVEGT